MTISAHPRRQQLLGYTSICLFLFPHDISKTHAHRIAKLFVVPPRVPKTYTFRYQKVKGQGHESQKYCRRGSLHCCECWLLPVQWYFNNMMRW